MILYFKKKHFLLFNHGNKGGAFISGQTIQLDPKIVCKYIDDRRQELAEAIVDRQYRFQPEFWEPYGEQGRRQSVLDAGFHLSYLSEAISASDISLFTGYIAWVKVLFKSLKFPTDIIVTTLKCVGKVLNEQLPQEMRPIVSEYIDAGLDMISNAPDAPPSFLDDKAPQGGLAGEYLKRLLVNDRRGALRLIMDAVDSGLSIRDIYLQVFQPTQYEVGRLWQTNQISVAQEHYCTAATQLIMAQLYPRLFSEERTGLKLIAVCVEEELHELGIRMVADFFEMEGWDTIYLGANTPARSVLRTLKENKVDVLAISATMTFHVSKVKELIEAVRSDEATRHIKIIVGGYPFNNSPGLWRHVGADGFAGDAREAVEIAKKLAGT
ncbi:MAG TPA: cobalamin-dependent protein [Methanocella sp.]|uniref:cobalamin B12-binding domain-containing protein n=1 Tax=Methanocella sp. TaxID=2052833 RepID=UPI002BA79F55|nr:cobalamin-dependent protein [Methanocella sp.]HTY90142.1 cobalamin-dependent protein [Methanocella sp.]